MRVRTALRGCRAVSGFVGVLALALAGCTRASEGDSPAGEASARGRGPETPVPIEELAGPEVRWESVLAAAPGGGTYQGYTDKAETLTGPELTDRLFSYARSLGERGGFSLLVLAPATERSVRGIGLCGRTKDTLAEVSRATGGTVWRQLGHGLVCCFGTEADLQRLASGPPTSLPPVLLQGDSPAALLMLLHKFWGLNVAVEPNWLQEVGAAMQGPFAEEEREAALWVVSQPQPGSFAQWMENVATSLGGEVEQRETQWVFRRYVNGEQLRRAAERLIAALRKEDFPWGTPEAAHLGRLGEPAVPALVQALKPTEPSFARVVVSALGETRSPEAVEPLLAALAWPASLPDERYPDERVTGLQVDIVEALGKIGDPRAVPALQAMLADAKAEADLKQVLWVALGNIAPRSLAEEQPSRAVQTAPAQMRLNLVTEPKAHDSEDFGEFGDEPAIAIRQSCRDERGEWWAAFFFARYGGGSDIWIARSGDRKTWEDYLFTGCTLAQQEAGFPEARIAGFKVSQGTVTLAWARPEEKTKRAVLAIAELRRDTDGDGLTDLLEKRLQTDPEQADTDRDGLSDSEDRNPLAAPNPHPTDEQQIIQAAFAHLYRGDTSQQVKLVTVFGLGKQELYGYPGLVLCLTGEEVERFRTEVGCGPESVSFVAYKRAGKTWTETSPVAFTDNGQRARVEVRTYRDGRWGGGYHGILKRVEGRWVIVEWKMDWIA